MEGEKREERGRERERERERERGINVPLTQPITLARLDCNEVPFILERTCKREKERDSFAYGLWGLTLTIVLCHASV